MEKASVIVLTHNNERTIKQCISSVKGLADELIIIDDFSSDSTLPIIKKIFPRVKVFSRSLNKDFSAQRNFGLSKAKTPWVFMIDSDEVATDKLIRNIRSVLSGKSKFDVYTARIKNYSLGRGNVAKLKRPLLFRASFRFTGRLHEYIKTKKIGRLSGYIDHLSWINCEDWIDDMNEYSTRQAQRWISDGRKFNLFTLFLIGILFPPFMFIKMYLIESRWKRGFFAGFLYCLGCSSEHLFSVLKYYEKVYLK